MTISKRQDKERKAIHKQLEEAYKCDEKLAIEALETALDELEADPKT